MALKIAFFSFADIDNFGDILFSHIFKMEMEKRTKDFSIDFYTPSQYSVEGIDYAPYNREKVEQNDYDALIVFGGEVIHLYDERTWKPIYKKNNQQLESKLPSDVIFDWTDFPKPFKAWISVGVRPIETETDYLKIQKVIDNLDYISTRGNLSKKILENLVLQFNNSKIEITPDMGWLFPDLLDYTDSRGKLYPKHIDQNRYLVFQINNITAFEAKQISGYLNDFQKANNIKVVLLPVIRPWEDKKYLKMINDEAFDNFLLLDNDLSIFELADILIHAEIVLASSLHATITALSAGVPAAIVNKWHGTKLQDLFGHQYRLNMVTHQLDEIPRMLQLLLKEKENGLPILKAYSTFMKLKLAHVFSELLNNIEIKKQRMI